MFNRTLHLVLEDRLVLRHMSPNAMLNVRFPTRYLCMEKNVPGVGPVLELETKLEHAIEFDERLTCCNLGITHSIYRE